MEITSPANLKIKNLKKLQQKKYRQEFGEFLVENLIIIRDGLKAGYRPTAIFATPQFITKNKSEFNRIIKTSGLRDYFTISEKINKLFSNLETPMGIAATYKIPKEIKLSFDQSILYLNSIGDPGNLGAIFRSALAFGFKNIILDETCADPYNFKAISAAKDAIFKVNVSYDSDLKILKQIKGNLPIISTRMTSAKNIETLRKYKNLCLVLGDESRGVDKNIEKLADEFVKINISNEIESLNVAVAAAVILHYVYNKS